MALGLLACGTPPAIAERAADGSAVEAVSLARGAVIRIQLENGKTKRRNDRQRTTLAGARQC